MATDEEIIQAGRVFAKAYYRGCDNSEHYAESEASNVRSRTHHFARQAEEFGKMGYPLPGGATSSVAGCSTNGAAVVRALEQQLENVKATVEALSKAAEPNKKELKFLTYALHLLGGREEFEQRGVVESLKTVLPK